jgi:hypothetical protein
MNCTTCEALVQSQALALAVDERDSNLRNKDTRGEEIGMVVHWHCAEAETHLCGGLRAVNFRDMYGSGGNKSGGGGGTRGERSTGALRMEQVTCVTCKTRGMHSSARRTFECVLGFVRSFIVL